MMILMRLDGVLCQKERIFSPIYFHFLWPRGRKLGSLTAPLLRLQFRISPWEWISVSCVSYVSSSTGVVSGQDESYSV